MALEVLALSITQITAIVAMGFFLWHVFSKRFDAIDSRFEKVDDRFGKVDERFEKVDERFEKVDERFEKVDQRFDKLAADMAGQINELAKDHQSLARELSEFRGEVRGRLDALLSRHAADT